MNENAALVHGFEAGKLEALTHEDHVRVAWLLLAECELSEALSRFRRGAQALAAARGRPEIYHETMTCAYLFIIHERMVRDRGHVGDAGDWNHFRCRHGDLLDHSRSVLAHYYKARTLDSELARRCFLMPDRGFTGAPREPAQ